MAKKFFLVLGIIIFGTIIDYVVHNSDPAFYVPFDYFPNKIIFGTFWGLIFLFVAERLSLSWFPKSIFVPLMVAIFLQAKYFLDGYDLYFVVLFLFLHFLMFLPASIFITYKYLR